MKKFFVIFIAALTLTSCGGKGQGEGKDSTATTEGSIRIDGSSTVFPIAQMMAEEFGLQNADAEVNVGFSGTGSGFKKFMRKEIDICTASRPIKTSEDSTLKASGIEYYEIPVAFDGLVVVVNPENDWVDYLTVAELKKIWEPAAEGKIMTWNQIRPTWPNQPIKLYGAGTASGTFDYFTEAINGKAKASRTDYSPSEDDNVLVTGIQGDKNSLGYFGLDYYVENKEKLKLVPIDDQIDANGKGAIFPDSTTITSGSYQPLSRPLFIYVSKASAARPEVEKFVQFFIANSPKFVPESGYVSLPTTVYDLIGKRYNAHTTGSVFVNMKTSVGVKLQDVLK